MTSRGLKNEKPLLTVIIPTYNIERYLRACLDSVVDQTYETLEIIIIDDDSSDGTPDIIRDYAAKDARVKPVFHETNQGPGSTRNEGLELASGDYVTLMDHDDWQDPTKYEKMMAKALHHDADFVVCDAREYRQEHGKYVRKPWRKHMRDVNPNAVIDLGTWDNKALFVNSFTPPWAKVMKEQLIRDNRIRFAADGRLFDDALFSRHLCLLATRAAYVPEVLYTHRLSSGSISGRFREQGDVAVRDSLRTWRDLEDICHAHRIDPRNLFRHVIKKLARYAYRAEDSDRYIADIAKIIHDLGMRESDFPEENRVHYRNVMYYSPLRRRVMRSIRKAKLKLQVLGGRSG